MDVKEISSEGLELTCEMKLSSKDLENSISSKLEEYSKSAKLPGFRPGKVPMKIVEQKFRNSVESEEVKRLVEKNVSEYIKNEKLYLATNAIIDNVDYEKGKDLKFKVTFEKMPNIDEVDFSKVKIEKPFVKISDKEIQDSINEIASRKKDYKIATKAAKSKKEDKVKIDFEGFVDGKAFDGGKAEGHELVLGSGQFIPGFEDQLIGKKAGEDVTVSVKFPEQYHENLAGKDAEFKVKVHEIHNPIDMEINDDFAKTMGLENLDHLKTNIRKMLEERYEEPSITHQKMKLFDHLEDKLKFDVPKSLLSREKESLINQLNQYKDSDPDLKKKSDEELKEKADTIAVRRVRIGLMLADYAKNNDLKVTQDDIKNSIMEQARSYPGSENQVIDFYNKNPDAVHSLTGPILEDKSVKHILGNKVKITEKEYTSEEFTKIIEDLDRF